MKNFENQFSKKKKFNVLKKNEKSLSSKIGKKSEFKNVVNQSKENQIPTKLPTSFFKKKLVRGYSKIHELKLVTIGIASPEKIQSWAEKELPNGKIFGEVTNANTFHYRTFKPSKGGLFCERIFGPLKDFECACGKRQKPNALESRQILEHEQTTRYFCTNCDVEYTWSIIRRYQLGYIKLNAPVAHLWYFKANPSYLSILFDMKRKDLFSIIYCTDTITIENMWKSAEQYSTFNRTPTDLYVTWQKFLNFEEKMQKFELFFRTKKQEKKQKKILFRKSYFSEKNFTSGLNRNPQFSFFFEQKKMQNEKPILKNSLNENLNTEKTQNEVNLVLLNNKESNEKRQATFQLISKQKQKKSFHLLFQNIWKKMIKDTYQNTSFFNYSNHYMNRNFQKKFIESFQVFFFFSNNSKNFIEFLKKNKNIFSLFDCETQSNQKNFNFSKLLKNFKEPTLLENSNLESYKTKIERKKTWSFLLFSFQFGIFLLVQKNKKQKSKGSFSKKDLLFLINIIPFLQKISKFETETSNTKNFQKFQSFFIKTFLLKQKKHGLQKSFETLESFSNFYSIFFKNSLKVNKNTDIKIHSKKNKKIFFSLFFSKIVQMKQFDMFQNEFSLFFENLEKKKLFIGTKQVNLELKKTFTEAQKKKYLNSIQGSLEKISLFFKWYFQIEGPFLYSFNQNISKPLTLNKSESVFVSEQEIPQGTTTSKFLNLTEKEFQKFYEFVRTNSKLTFVFETLLFQYFSLLFFFLFSFDFSRGLQDSQDFENGNPIFLFFDNNKRNLKKQTNHKLNKFYMDFVNLSSLFLFNITHEQINENRNFEIQNTSKKESQLKIKIENKFFTRKEKQKKQKKQICLNQFEKFQPFIWTEPKTNFLRYGMVSSQTRNDSTVSSLKIMNQKQNRKLQKISFLKNSVLTISYNYVWTNDSDWKFFVYYNSFFFSEFGDIPIFCYKSLASNFSTILGNEFQYFQKTLFSTKSGRFSNQRNQTTKNRSLFTDTHSSSAFVPDFFASSTKHFFVGAGILEKFLTEYTSSELKKMTKQHQILLPKIHHQIRILKQIAKTKKDFLKIQKYFQKREHIIRRLKFLRKFFRRNSNPTYMILHNLPVLPPDLRPILKLQNQIAASDLNRFYQRILYRNERFKKFAKDSATNQSFEMKYAQRLLQEAVDNLIQNGKGNGKAETNSRGQPLKSLSEILKGKQGRFRQYLLGKRVDYSGRSVIVVGPKLKLYECGIPKEMAFELFLPFLIQQALQYKLAQTVVGAKNLLRSEHNLALNLLTKVMKNVPVLLNRAPTLHRLGFQAFLPKLIEGRAILLHPMVCPGFNADFDGDQMAVHIPLTVEARTEAWKFMLATNNLINAATGEPVLLPSQDMVLGCYYLTTDFSSKSLYVQISNTLKAKKFKNFQQMKNQNKSFLFFHNIQYILFAFQKKEISLHTPIWLRWNSPVDWGNEIAKPVEIRLQKTGNWQLIQQKATLFYTNKNKNYSTYIRTTVGRILMNLMIQECIRRNI